MGKSREEGRGTSWEEGKEEHVRVTLREEGLRTEVDMGW